MSPEYTGLCNPADSFTNELASLVALPGADTGPAFHGGVLICAFAAHRAARGLALPLLVTRLGAADDPQNTLATYDFAVTADLFNRSAYFHDLTSIQSNCEQVTH